MQVTLTHRSLSRELWYELFFVFIFLYTSLAGLGLQQPGDVGVSLGTSDTIFSIVDEKDSSPGLWMGAGILLKSHTLLHL